MRHLIRSFVARRVAAAFAAAAMLGCLPAMAQTAAAPPAPAAKEIPRPQDIDPAVDTSRTPPADSGAASRSQDLPRPQDVNPGVDTSATSPSTTAPPATGTAASKPVGSPTT